VRDQVNRRIAAMILLQLHSGMRPGEVVQMVMRAIDMTGSIWIYTPPRFKSEHHRKARRVYLGPRSQDILREWLRTELDAPLFQPVETGADRAAEKRSKRATKLWLSHVAHQARKRKRWPIRTPGALYTVASYRRAIARACEAAKVPVWGPHGLRHAAASVMPGVRRESARIVLGHSKIDTTRLYGAVDEGKAIEAMSKIG
jgi:integrase